MSSFNIQDNIFENENLFKNINNENVYQYFNKGGLIVFNYLYWMNDPYPLVIITDYIMGNRVRGINLHYLTFPFIKDLLNNSCDNRSFSYRNVKDNSYIVKAFRTYKWSGIRQIKVLDCEFLLKVMGITRSYDPNEIDAIKNSIQSQLETENNLNVQDYLPEDES